MTDLPDPSPPKAVAGEGDELLAPADAEIAAFMKSVRTIAVVGMSRNPGKPSYEVPRQLLADGYALIPVNPAAEQILGISAKARLVEISEPVDLVDVFRPADEAAEIARAAVEIGARGLWLQLGISSDEARAIALSAGLFYVEDRCVAIERRRLAITGPRRQER